MNRNYYLRLINSTYQQAVDILLKKYGTVKENYFLGTTKNKNITKTDKGLFCHHILENIVPNLSDVTSIKNYPKIFQHKKYLVYCNMLEHYILHYLIFKEKDVQYKNYGIGGILHSLGISLNSIYFNERIFIPNYDKIKEVIDKDYYSYLVVLERTIKLIEKRNEKRENKLNINLLFKTQKGLSVEDSIKNDLILLEENKIINDSLKLLTANEKNKLKYCLLKLNVLKTDQKFIKQCE